MALVTLAVCCCCLTLATAAAAPAGGNPRWLWVDDAGMGAAPVNTFAVFRTDFTAPAALSAAAALRVAASSNAAVFLNGVALQRKVTRFATPDIRATVHSLAPGSRAAAALRLGAANTLVVQLFSWGNVTTFQRVGERHAGLFVSSGVGVNTSLPAAWRWVRDPAPLPLTKQILGLAGTPRVRFPQILDQRAALPPAVFTPGFNTSSWRSAAALASPPFPTPPADVEAAPQDVGPVVQPHSVLHAGVLHRGVPLNNTDAYNMADTVLYGTFQPQAAVTASLSPGAPFTLPVVAGQSVFVTVDFGLPLHGYPVVNFTAAGTPGTWVDLTYQEKPFDQYSGDTTVSAATGAINPIAIVGHGYGDRVIAAGAAEVATLPDERTMRWLTVVVHCPPATCAPAPGATIALAVGVERTGYPAPALGSFHSGDATVDAIRDLSLQFARVAMSDALVDTPGREDGMWIEDARPRGVLAASWFGAGALRAVLLRVNAEGQQPTGATHPFYPSNYADTASLDWEVQWAAALWDAYLWTGDAGVVATYWPTLVRMWSYVLSFVDAATGLWVTADVLADIRVGVHCPQSGGCVSGIVMPWITERLAWSVAMALAVNQTQQAAAWNATRNLMVAAFRTKVVQPAAGDVPAHVPDILLTAGDVGRGVSQAGHTVAVYSGLLPAGVAQRAVDYVFPAPDGTPVAGVTRWNNPTYLLRSLKALTAVGRTARAVAHLKERFSQFLPASDANPVPVPLQGPSGGPLPEYWVTRIDAGTPAGAPNTAQPTDGTGSHGWCSVALVWFHECLLGVTIAAPGGSHLDIRPDNSGLPYVNGTVVVSTGVVSVALRPPALTLSIPTGVTSVVVTQPPTCGGGLTPTSLPPGATPKQLSPTQWQVSAPVGVSQWACAAA